MPSAWTVFAGFKRNIFAAAAPAWSSDALAPRLMRDLGVTNGFRTLINTGHDGLQEVQHVHMHVMGGPRPWLKG